MSFRLLLVSLVYTLLPFSFHAAHAASDPACRYDPRPAISFIDFSSLDLTKQPPTPLKVKGMLKQPVEWHRRNKCFLPKPRAAAVLILHGSGGVDSRGDFYARALNAVGIATLEIDMWEARGVTGGTNRPAAPLFTYPDAFAALAYLSAHPDIDPKRIGVFGISWGAVVTMASATEGVANRFGNGLRFKAHAANYPICYAYNNPAIPNLSFGSHSGNPLTGAPILVQIGSEDDYDEGAAPCLALQASLIPAEQDKLKVMVYEGAYHAWDRLMVPVSPTDPFAHLGAGGTVEAVPNVDHAYKSQRQVAWFFLRNL